MAIVELADSGREHRTIEVWTATMHYHMLQLDYRNRGGILMNPANGNVNGNGTQLGYIELPYEGMPYGANTDLVCVDIDENPISQGNLLNGNDRILDVVYTWSNDSRYYDAPRANAASSWRIWWNGSLESATTDAYVNLENKLIYGGEDGDNKTYIVDWMNQWFEYKYGTEWTKYQTDNAVDPANPTDEEWDVIRGAQQPFLTRHASEVPELEMRYPRVFFNFTFFTSKILNFTPYLGFINSTDFITKIYERREEALQHQLKNGAYATNDKVAGIERFMLVDIQHTERTSSLHEYTLIWEENVQGWNNYDPDDYTTYLDVESIGGIDTSRYQSVDFYSMLSGADDVETTIPY